VLLATAVFSFSVFNFRKQRKMNVVQAMQDYISKMLANIPGMKVLVLDKETVWFADDEQ
jgi:hypothetical protein